MKLMKRNTQDFYFALYRGKGRVLDEEGKPTFELVENYSKPIKMKGCVSYRSGATNMSMSRQQFEPFGIYADYDKILIVDNPKLPFNSDTLFWIDNIPQTDENGEYKYDDYDYVTIGIARSLNYIAVAIKRIK